MLLSSREANEEAVCCRFCFTRRVEWHAFPVMRQAMKLFLFLFFLLECHKDGSSLDIALSYHLSVAPIDVMAPRLVSSRRRALILISWPNEASQLGCGSGGKRSSAKTGTFCALVNKATGMESWRCECDDVSSLRLI